MVEGGATAFFSSGSLTSDPVWANKTRNARKTSDSGSKRDTYLAIIGYGAIYARLRERGALCPVCPPLSSQ